MITDQRPQNWTEVAAGMFTTGKRLSPARFPALPDKNDPEAIAEFDALCETWGEELEHINLTPRIWQDAVKWWCRHSNPDARWDIAEARRAGLRVLTDWQADPQKQEILDQWRDWYRRRRVARGELPEDTTPALPLVDSEPLQLGGRHSQERADWRRRMGKFRAELERRRGVA